MFHFENLLNSYQSLLKQKLFINKSSIKSSQFTFDVIICTNTPIKSLHKFFLQIFIDYMLRTVRPTNQNITLS